MGRSGCGCCLDEAVFLVDNKMPSDWGLGIIAKARK